MPGTSPFTQSASENNPGSPNPLVSALKGIGNDWDAFEAGTANAPDPNAPQTPAHSPATDNPQKAAPFTGQPKTNFDPTPSADESVANTPEAPDTPVESPKATAAANALSPLEQTLAGHVPRPKQATLQSDINATLKPDIATLSSLPGDYKSAMSTIDQYLHGPSTGVPTLDAADAQVANATDASTGPIEKALGGLSSAAKEFEGTVPYSSIVQAMLGFGKYQETYEGYQPKTTEWSDSMKSIYSYLSGQGTAATGQGSGSSLPSPTVAASTAAPGTGTTPSSTTGGGNY